MRTEQNRTEQNRTEQNKKYTRYQDYVIKGISTNLSQGNPNNPAGQYKDKNKGLNDRIVKPKIIKTLRPFDIFFAEILLINLNTK